MKMHFFAASVYRSNMLTGQLWRRNWLLVSMESAMSAKPTPFLTEAEYLELERRAEYKSEYFAGHMFAMAGASPRHVLIVTNIVGELRQRLRRSPCRVY